MLKIEKVKDKYTQQDSISINCNARSDVAPSSSTVYLQIYNRNSLEWETLASNNTALANIDFDLTGTQTTNLSNYFDANFWVSCRVYQ